MHHNSHQMSLWSFFSDKARGQGSLVLARSPRVPMQTAGPALQQSTIQTGPSNLDAQIVCRMHKMSLWPTPFSAITDVLHKDYLESLLRDSQHQIRHLVNQHPKNMSVWLMNSVFEGAFPLADLIASNFGFPLLLPGLNNDATSQLAANLWKLSCVCFCGIPSVLAWLSGKSNRSLALGSFVYHSILVWISIQSFRGVGGMPVGPWIYSEAADNQTLLSVLQGGVHGLMAFLFLQHLQG
jgi:hypothetical protein